MDSIRDVIAQADLRWEIEDERAAFCAKLVESWACLDKFPLQRAAQGRLAKTLCTACVSKEHARRVASEFTEFCPNPAGILRAAERLGPQPEDQIAKLRREFIAEVRRALMARDEEALTYYTEQHPEIVAQERRKLAGAA